MIKLNSEKLIHRPRYGRQVKEMGQHAFLYSVLPPPPSLAVHTAALFPRVKQTVVENDMYILATRLKMRGAIRYTCTPLYVPNDLIHRGTSFDLISLIFYAKICGPQIF